MPIAWKRTSRRNDRTSCHSDLLTSLFELVLEVSENMPVSQMRASLLLLALLTSCDYAESFRHAAQNKMRFKLPSIKTYERNGLSAKFVDGTDNSSTEREHACNKALKVALLQNLSVDLAKLSTIRPVLPAADFSAPAAIISAGSSYTRIWTHSTWESHSRPPHVRYTNHVLRWGASSTARKILPTVLLAAAWAALVARLARSNFWVLRFLTATEPSKAFGFLAAPLALLLTLRANASMQRLLEARLLWGRLILHTRSLASVIRVYLYPACPQASTLAIRHIAMMGWILKATLRGESSESQQAVLRVMLPDERDFQWLASHPKTSVAVTYRLRQICSHMLESLIDRSSSSAIKFVIEDKIGSLEEVVGGCERLFGSPIPPTYSRHLSRVVVMWVLLLPMSLLSSPGLSTLGISIATAVGTYVLVGIDEVGMEIENVFQMLPLQQLAGAVQNDVRDQFIPKQGEMPRVIL